MIYNIYFDIFAVAISFFSIILAFTKRIFRQRLNFILFILLVATFVASVLDIVSSVGNSFLVEWSYGVRDFLNYSYIALQHFMPYLFCLYTIFLTNMDGHMDTGQRRVFHLLFLAPYMVDVVLLCLNPFMREVFYYDENGVYTHGWGMTVLYVIVFFYFSYNYYLLFRYGKEIRMAKKAMVYVLLTSTIAAVVTQVFFPTLLIQLCVAALCLSGMLFSVENRNDILHSIMLYLCLLFLGIFLEIRIIPDVFPWGILESTYFMILSLVLVQYFMERISDRGRLKFWMLAGAWMMVLFFTLRMIENDAFPADSVPARITWYLYYLPLLFIPLFTFYAVSWIGEDSGSSAMKKWYGAITLGMFLFVLTNDWHQKVFGFHDGFAHWDDYTYEIGYLAILMWIFVLYLTTIVTMFKKCRPAGAWKIFGIMMFPFAVGIVMMILLAVDAMPRINGVRVVELPEATCFMIALFWELCIRTGLIPSNKGYGELMWESSLAMQITDKRGNVIHRSVSAWELRDAQKNITGPYLLDKDTELYREEITGGYIFWQNDISAMNEVNEQLEEVRSYLEEESELLRLENELKEKRTSIEKRTRLYTLISAKTAKQSEMITALVEGALNEKDAGERQSKAGMICFLGAYIKRYANLRLLAEKSEGIGSAELGMAIAEPLRYLAHTGIPTEYVGSGNIDFPSEDVIFLYETYEALIERYLNDLRAVSVRLENDKNFVLKINMEGVSVSPDETSEKELERKGITTTVKIEDGISYVVFRAVGRCER